MIKSKIFLWIRVLSLIGTLLAIYLLLEQVSRSDFQPCNINDSINCDAIISGSVSKTLGLPTPLYGLIGYIVIYFAAVFKRKRIILSMAAFGIVFCLWIAYRELFELQVICPACILCQLIMVAVFSFALIINRSKK